MRKTLAWSLTLGVLLSFIPAFGQDQAAAPSYRDGDSWQFNVVEKGSTSSSTRGLDGDYRVFFKGGEVRVVPVNQEKSDFKQNVAQLKRMLAIEYKDQLLQFPLALNSKWTADFQNALGSGVSQAVHAEMSVNGYEEVTTGAGKIAAFKIERYETFRSGGRSRNSTANMRHSQYLYFYSPETRSIVKFHREEQGGATHDFELIKFSPAK